MDSMEINKGVAAVLVAGIVFFLSGTIGTVLVHENLPEKTAIKIEMPEAAAPAGKPAPVESPPIANLLAKAEVPAGEAYTKKICVACHSFTEGGKAGVGPNLYNVVGSPHGQMAGFNYSEALKSKKGPWTFDELNEWLRNPAAYAPGTRMTYAGIKNDQDRANVIDYLHTLSPNPEALPAPVATQAAAAPAGAAPAAPEQPSIDSLLASADPARGEADTKKLGCIACHTFTDGGKAGLGPNLYGVVGAPHGHMEGYTYSAALKGKQGPWTYQALNEWLTNPAAYAPGTRMTFMGIKNPQDRADVIDYLRTLAQNPEPLPAK
jgi:cytochrome c